MSIMFSDISYHDIVSYHIKGIRSHGSILIDNEASTSRRWSIKRIIDVDMHMRIRCSPHTNEGFPWDHVTHLSRDHIGHTITIAFNTFKSGRYVSSIFLKVISIADPNLSRSIRLRQIQTWSRCPIFQRISRFDVLWITRKILSSSFSASDSYTLVVTNLRLT